MGCHASVMALLKKEIPDASASAINGPPVKKRLLEVSFCECEKESIGNSMALKRNVLVIVWL